MDSYVFVFVFVFVFVLFLVRFWFVSMAAGENWDGGVPLFWGGGSFARERGAWRWGWVEGACCGVLRRWGEGGGMLVVF